MSRRKIENLKAHLDSDAERAKHRGFPYLMWRLLRTAGLNTTAMAKAFNISFNTAKSYIAIDDAELARKKAKQEKEVEELRP